MTRTTACSAVASTFVHAGGAAPDGRGGPPPRPAAAATAPAGVWGRLAWWLMAPAPQDAASLTGRLQPVRDAFAAVLSDVDGDDAQRLRHRIAQAPTLQALWHLRSEVYRVVGVALSQRQARERLARLNRHFPPTRSPRSQFAEL